MTIEGPIQPPEELTSIEEEVSKKGLSKQATNIIRAVVLLVVIALTVVLLIYRDQIQTLQGYGYPGIFLFPSWRMQPFWCLFRA